MALGGSLSKLYFVFVCPRCGSLRYARESQKTARCFTCGYRVPIDPARIRILFKTEKSEEAMAAVQNYKMRRGKKG